MVGQRSAQSLQRLSQMDDGVVIVRHRTVPGTSMGNQVDVRAALLGNLAGVDRLAIHEHGEATCLIDPVLGIEPFRMMFGEPRHAIRPTHLFVGRRDQHQIPLQRQFLAMCHQQNLQVHGSGEL